jgi:hypothetical protein
VNAFNCKLISTFAPDRDYRVFLVPEGVFFIQISGQKLGRSIAIHFGLLGERSSRLRKAQLPRDDLGRGVLGASAACTVCRPRRTFRSLDFQAARAKGHHLGTTNRRRPAKGLRSFARGDQRAREQCRVERRERFIRCPGVTWMNERIRPMMRVMTPDVQLGRVARPPGGVGCSAVGLSCTDGMNYCSE